MRHIIISLLMLCSLSIQAQQSIVRYVDPRPLASGKEDASYYDGTSWEKAMPNLQDAINMVRSSMEFAGYYTAEGALKAGYEPGMIYVAGTNCTRNTDVPTTSPYYNTFFNPDGTYHGGIIYTPTESTERDKDGVLYTSFKMYPGVNVYGGYHGNVTDADGNVILAGETGEELKPENRIRDWQWNYKYKTILSGNHGGRATTFTWNNIKNMYDAVYPGNSYHVVWFATSGFGVGPNKRAKSLPSESILNGCVIQDGRAGNHDLSATDYSQCHTAYGGGAYMVENSVISNCVFLHNGAVRAGGAAYMDGGGLIDHCMIQKAQAEGNGVGSGLGGGVCLADDGMVRHSFIANCYANMGGGIAITHEDNYQHYHGQDNAGEHDTEYSEALVVSSLVTNNNAGTEAGGIYMHHGGILNQVTVTKNRMTGPNTIIGGVAYGRSAGVFVDRNARILNTVMWGGFVRTLESEESHDDLQFAANTIHSTDELRPDVQYSALSYNEITDWNGCVRNSVLSLSATNSGDDITGATLYPNFIHVPLELKEGVTSDFDNDANYEPYVGVCRTTMKLNHSLTGYSDEKGEDVDNNNFHYGTEQVLQVHATKHYGDGILFPNHASALRSNGIRVEDLTNDPLMLRAMIDVDAKNQTFMARTTIGAIRAVEVEATPVLVNSVETAEGYTEENEGQLPTLFVDPNYHGVPDDAHVGQSWATPLTNINDALAYMDSYLKAHTEYKRGQVLVKQGKLDISGQVSIGNRLRECFVLITSNTRVFGGYPSTNTGISIENRSPRKYETHLTGNLIGYTTNETQNYDYNATHVVSMSGADNATLDGFHIMYGNATWINPEGTGEMPRYRIANSRGGGFIASDEQASLPFVQEILNDPERLTRVRHNVVRNCVFANNTATNGSAVYVNARYHKVKFDFINCAFRNNHATVPETYPSGPKDYYDSEEQTYDGYNGTETGYDSPCTVFLSTQYAPNNAIESLIEAKFDHCNFMKNVGYAIGISGLPGTTIHTAASTGFPEGGPQLLALQKNDNISVKITNSILWANTISPKEDSELLANYEGDGKDVRTWYARGIARDAVRRQNGEFGAIYGIDNISSPQAQAVMLDRWMNGYKDTEAGTPFTGYAMLTYKDEASSGIYTFPIFQNPTKNIGAAHGKQNTQYGGSCSYMPRNMNPVVNAAINSTQAYDYGRVPRTYGGAADIGYIENTEQPLSGTLYYVRDYSATGTNTPTYDQGGTERLDRLGIYNQFGQLLDGSTWARAINGNATYPMQKTTTESRAVRFTSKQNTETKTVTTLNGFYISCTSGGVTYYLYLNGNTPAVTTNMSNATLFSVSGITIDNYQTANIFAGTHSISANNRYLTVNKSGTRYSVATATTSVNLTIAGTTAQGYTIYYNNRYYYVSGGSLSASTSQTRWKFEPKTTTETKPVTEVVEVMEELAPGTQVTNEGHINANTRIFAAGKLHVYENIAAVTQLLDNSKTPKAYRIGMQTGTATTGTAGYAYHNNTDLRRTEDANTAGKFVLIYAGSPNLCYIYDIGRKQYVYYIDNTSGANKVNEHAGTENATWWIIPSATSNRWSIVPGSINPVENNSVTWNYYAGLGNAIGLYSRADGNSQWVFESVDEYDAYSINTTHTEPIQLNGLQYAVDMAHQDMSVNFVAETQEYQEKYNGGTATVQHRMFHLDTDLHPEIQVWVGAGTYTYLNGWDIRNHVKVYGAFPKTGNPTTTERHPQLTTGVALSKANQGIPIANFETILQTHTTNPCTDAAARTNPTSVLTHPVECRVTTGDDSNVPQSRVVYEGAEWDGFTIRYGYKHGVTGSGGGRRNSGPGVSLYENVILRNCVVRDNYLDTGNGRSGGVYCDGSTIINCYIMNNVSGCASENFGGGLYMIKGTIYNSVICGNSITGGNPHGCGAFFESANFYNNTVVDNTGADAIGVYTASAADAHLTLYNSIIMAGESEVLFRQNSEQSNTPVKFSHCFIQTTQSQKTNGSNRTDNTGISDAAYANKLFFSTAAATANPFVLSESDARNNRDYRINQKTGTEARYTCVNMGTEDLGKDYDGKQDVVLPEKDMDFTDRIQDCTVDIGAYEFNGAYLIAPTVVNDTAYYYVTQNGRGLSSGNDPANAACWQKLQKILDAAGRYLYDNPTKNVVVKIAGDNKVAGVWSGFKYLPTRNAGENELEQENPRFYSYMIPHGVELWGGYSDAFTSNTVNGFTEDNRSITEHPSYILGQHFENGEYVDSYHCLTFTNTLYDVEGKPITDRSLTDKSEIGQTIVDGIFITGGKATGETEDTQRGGAAIVPDYAIIRNCIIEDNEASLQGGALYLLKGSKVLGCLIKKNTAGIEGGGVAIEDYVYNDGSTTNPDLANDYPMLPRLIGCTVVLNTAKRGGGLSFHTQARTYATVLWQNEANEYDNVYGVFEPQKTVSPENTFDQYPMSYCAVENVRVAGLDNISVSSRNDEGVRFKTDEATLTKNGTERINYSGSDYQDVDTYFGLEEYSVLVRTGVPTYMYYQYKPIFHYRAEDFMDVPRVYVDDVTGEEVDFIDIGARAVGKFMRVRPVEGMIMTRLFVVPAADVEYGTVKKLQLLSSSDNPTEKIYSQQGSTFAYPMQQLDDALMYIREARMIKAKANGTDPQGNEYHTGEYAYRNTTFEVFISGGSFYPMRNIRGEHSQSSSSTFLIPEGVHVFGGLNNDDMNGSRLYRYCQETSGTKTVGTGANAVELDPMTTVAIRLYHRRLYDLNANSIIEPWEHENQTILNGEVVNDLSASEKTNSYHVVTIIPAEEYVGGLPDKDLMMPSAAGGDGIKPHQGGKTVVLDGLMIQNGRAHSQSSEAANPYDIYKGAGIYVNGSWMSEGDGTPAHPYNDVFKDNADEDVKDNHDSNKMGYRNIPVVLRSCKFMGNEAGEGAAIWSNGQLEIYSCSFEANKAISGSETVVDNSRASVPLKFDGKGGVVFSSNLLTAVNTLFANNEAEIGGVVYVGGNGSSMLMNCDLVRNKATEYPCLYYDTPNFKTDVVPAHLQPWRWRPQMNLNTVFWGNEAQSNNKVANLWTSASAIEEQMWFCAYEEGVGSDPVYDSNQEEWKNYRKVPFVQTSGMTIGKMFTNHKFVAPGDDRTKDQYGEADVNMNVIIASTNDTDDGPNFGNPSITAGVSGYTPSADWMPARQNNLTDNGWTYVSQKVTYNSTTKEYDCHINTYGEPGFDPVPAENRFAGNVVGDGAYWAMAYSKFMPEKLMIFGEIPYMQLAKDYPGLDPTTWLLRVSKDPNPSQNQTYIDIGVYEYQHVQLKPSTYGETDILWVSTKEKPDNGVADGSSWQKPTSDVQRAIETLMASRNDHHKAIHFVEGDYTPVYTVSGNLGFLINTTHLNNAVSVPDDGQHGVLSMSFRGGFSADVESQNDPATWIRNWEEYPSIIRSSERAGILPSVLGHTFYIADAHNIKSQQNNDGTFTHKSKYDVDKKDGSGTEKKSEIIPITFDGLQISNSRSSATEGGAAIYYADQYKWNENGTRDGEGFAERTEVLNTSSTDPTKLYPAKLTIKNCVFFANGARTDQGSQGVAVSIGRGGVKGDGTYSSHFAYGVDDFGSPLIYNCLFHSNAGKSIDAYDTRIVNCTFALNGGGIELKNEQSSNKWSSLYTSMLWRNGTTEYSIPAGNFVQQNLIYNIEDDATNGNFWLSNTNRDVADGPNFRNPNETFRLGITSAASKADVDIMQTRDFHLMPGMKTLSVTNRVPRAHIYFEQVSTDINNNLKSADGLDPAFWNPSWTIDQEHAPDILFNDYDLSGPMNKDNITNGYSRYRGKAVEYGAYEYKGDLQRIVYVNPSYNTNLGTGLTWNAAMEHGRLQEAINLGAVYANNNPGYDAFVFCKAATNTYNVVLPLDESIMMRPGVEVYGSISSEFIDEVTGFNAADISAAYATDHSTELIENYVELMRQRRPGMAEPTTKRTVISGIDGSNTLDKPSLVDGFDVCPETTVIDGQTVNVPITSPAVTIGPGNIGSQQLPIAIRNCIIHDFTATEGNVMEVRNGLLYDVLLRDNTLAPGNTTGYNAKVDRFGWILNCTLDGADNNRIMAYGAGSNATHLLNTLYGTRQQTAFSGATAPEASASGMTGKQPYAPYFTDGNYSRYALEDRLNLSYQLLETSEAINGTATVATTAPNIDASLRRYVNFAKDLDLLGNPRVLDNKLDYGCYETWATLSDGLRINNDRVDDKYIPASYGGNMYPHEGSVMYVSKPVIVESVPFSKYDHNELLPRILPGYFLLQEGMDANGNASGWYGTAQESLLYTGKGITELRLAYAAVERNLRQKDNLISLPFDYNYTRVPNATAFWYDGEARARWNYRFVAPSADGSESPCWRSATGTIPANQGVYLNLGYEVEDEGTPVRFTALTNTANEYIYTEKDGKTVDLHQYDAGKQSDITPSGNPHFTSKENMGWNLIGQPFMVSRYYTEENAEDEHYWTDEYLAEQPYQMHKPHEMILFEDAPAEGHGVYAAAYNSWDAQSNVPSATAFFTQTAVTEWNSDRDDAIVETLHFGLPKLATGISHAKTRAALTEFWDASAPKTDDADADARFLSKILVTDGILHYTLPRGITSVNIYRADGTLHTADVTEDVQMDVANGIYLIKANK